MSILQRRDQGDERTRVPASLLAEKEGKVPGHVEHTEGVLVNNLQEGQQVLETALQQTRTTGGAGA